MSEDNRPTETVTEGADVTPAEGEVKGSEGLSLERINELTGRNYTDLETATKAIQETYKHVGQKTEPAPSQESNVLEEVLNKQRALERTIEEDKFFRTNPDLQPYEKQIKALAGDRPLTEVVESEEVKELLTKARAYDETEKKKSTVMSSPRLGSNSDKLKEAAEAQSKGDVMAAGQLATKAVLESLGE